MYTLKSITVFFLLLFINTYAQQSVEKWDQIYKTINDIGELTFPEKKYNITDFGAIADGKTLNTSAINKAIEICSTQGGGSVIVSDGEYLTGAIHLKNNVNLHVKKSAKLKFSTNPKDYLPTVLTRWEGYYCYNYSPLIYANGQTNFAITGEGTIDGQASNEFWWPWAYRSNTNEITSQVETQHNENSRPQLTKWDNSLFPVEKRQMGEGHYLRPQLINFIYCKNVKIEGVTILNSPFWVIHPLLSENIIVRGVTVNSHGPNSDGCDPESCKNVLIEDCTFDTGDDCIAIKSGRNFDGRKTNVPSENILIRNCKMKDGHGGVVMGSEISAGCKNIFAENCEMSSPNLDRAIRIKTNNNRGGITDGIYVRNLEVGEVKEAVVKINCSYDPSEGQGKFPPMVRNVNISNINSEKASFGLSLFGIEGENCVENIWIEDCNFNGVENGNRILYVENLNLNKVFIDGEKIE